MTGFESLQTFNLLSNLLVGGLAFLSFVGCGHLVLGMPKVSNTPIPVLCCIGIFGVGTVIIVLSLLEFAIDSKILFFPSLGLLASFVIVISRTSFASLLKKWEEFRSSWHFRILIIVIVISLLLVSSLPSTKIDELHYAMLLPSRIIQDQGFRSYQQPYLNSALIQSIFPIALTPFHYIGFPHVGNVVSCLLYLSFSYFILNLVNQIIDSEFAANIAQVAVLVGLYPVVWMNSSGTHAVAEVAIATLLLMEAFPRCFRGGVKSETNIPWATILLVAAFATTKVSNFPLSILVIALCSIPVSSIECLIRGNLFKTARCVLTNFSVFLLIVSPALILTFKLYGSPFGAFDAKLFTSSIYDPMEIGATLKMSADINRSSYLPFFKSASLNRPLVVWLIVITAYALCLKQEFKAIRFPLFAMTFQLFLIMTLLPLDIRFLSGTATAVFVITWICLNQVKLPIRFTYLGLTLLLVAPWACIQFYYSAHLFVPYMKDGIKGYAAKFIALYEDYSKLNEILPKGSVIVISGVRANGFYSSRPVLYRRPKKSEFSTVYCLDVLHRKDDVQNEHEEITYFNPSAIVETYRTPNRPAQRGAVVVKNCK